MLGFGGVFGRRVSDVGHILTCHEGARMHSVERFELVREKMMI